MAVEIMAAVFRRYPSGGNERLLALAIADQADRNGQKIFPSVATLAEMSAQSERSVQRLVHVMLASGWLLLVRKSSGRRGDCNEYRISPEWLAGGDPVPPVVIPDRRTIKRATGTPVSAEKPLSTGDKLAPVAVAVDNVKTQPATGDTHGLSGDTAVSPNPYLPVNTQRPPYPPTGGASGFEDFWREWPRKVDQGKARAAWAALSPTAELAAEIVGSVKRWAKTEEWGREAGRFIPKPGNWLRNRRWQDLPGIALPPPEQAPWPETVQAKPHVPMPPDVRAKIESLLANKRRLSPKKPARQWHEERAA